MRDQWNSKIWEVWEDYDLNPYLNQYKHHIKNLSFLPSLGDIYLEVEIKLWDGEMSIPTERPMRVF